MDANKAFAVIRFGPHNCPASHSSVSLMIDRQARNKKGDGGGGQRFLRVAVLKEGCCYRIVRTHFTAIVTAGPVWPEMPMTTGTRSPAVTPAGSTALIWYTPTRPGVSPEN